MPDVTASKGRRRALAGLGLAAVGVAAGIGGYLASSSLRPRRTPDIPGLLWPPPPSLEPFSLGDHRGRPFDLSSLRGRWTLVFFGYTHCPDVCPVTLAVLKETEGLLAGGGEPVQYAFVSVDPARDTPELLGEYVSYFHPAFLGVTGEDAALMGLARQLGVLYIRNQPDENGSYLVDHSAALLLLDPEARLVGLFQAPHRAEAVAEGVSRIRAFVAG